MKKILTFVGISIGLLSIFFIFSINCQQVSITNNYKCLENNKMKAIILENIRKKL